MASRSHRISPIQLCPPQRQPRRARLRNQPRAPCQFSGLLPRRSPTRPCPPPSRPPSPPRRPSSQPPQKAKPPFTQAKPGRSSASLSFPSSLSPQPSPAPCSLTTFADSSRTSSVAHLLPASRRSSSRIQIANLNVGCLSPRNRLCIPELENCRGTPTHNSHLKGLSQSRPAVGRPTSAPHPPRLMPAQNVLLDMSFPSSQR